MWAASSRPKQDQRVAGFRFPFPHGKRERSATGPLIAIIAAILVGGLLELRSGWRASETSYRAGSHATQVIEAAQVLAVAVETAQGARRAVELGGRTEDIDHLRAAVQARQAAYLDLRRVASSDEPIVARLARQDASADTQRSDIRGLIGFEKRRSSAAYAQFRSDLLRILGALLALAIGVTAGAVAGADLGAKRQRAEKESRRNAAFLEAIVDSTSDLIWAKDLEGRTIYGAPAANPAAGGDGDETLGCGGDAFDLHPDQGRREAEARVINEGKRQVVRTHLVKPDGTWLHCRITMAPLRDASGAIMGVVGQTVDVTSAQTAASLLEVIGAASPDYIYAKDRDGRFIYANEAMLRFAGRPIDEILGQTSEIFDLRPEEIAEYEASDRNVIETGDVHVAETKYVTREGVLRVLLSRKFPLRAGNGEIIGLAAVSADITELYKARQALTDSEALFRAMASVSPNIVWSMTADGVFDYVNDRWYEFTGLVRGEPEPEWSSIVHPEDREQVVAAAELSRITGGPFDIAYRMRNADGDYRWGIARAAPVVSEVDGETRFMGSFTDTQELFEARQLAERALLEAEAREARLNSILDSVPDAMIIVDERGVIQSFSKAAERQFGWSAEEAVGREVGFLMAEELRDGYRQRVEQGSVISGTGGPTRKRGVGLRKDGATFPLEVVIAGAQSGSRRFYTSFSHDLTEPQAAERRLQDIQAELARVSRLSAMGEMATALAHELNQPLAASANFIQGSLRLMQRTPLDLEAIEGAMEASSAQLFRAGDTIRRLREFVSRGETAHRAEDLRGLIEEAATLAMMSVKGRGVRLDIQVQSGADRVLVDKVQIQQVLLNLLRNAAEAMADRVPRNLSVTAKPTDAGLVTVSVKDTGPGIAPDLMANLFQPFVTTKDEGMGVGLSISRTIVEAHGGTIWAESEPGFGATFRFTVCAADPEEMQNARLA